MDGYRYPAQFKSRRSKEQNGKALSDSSRSFFKSRQSLFYRLVGDNRRGFNRPFSGIRFLLVHGIRFSTLAVRLCMAIFSFANILSRRCFFRKKVSENYFRNMRDFSTFPGWKVHIRCFNQFSSLNLLKKRLRSIVNQSKSNIKN